ncbi:hypothetical protein THASP1DRAFT_30720 [Thamnocephalis sphaerospora]|uniref:Secreted protein n=1 Tax=Thamnocephalis sphaerospora TaxID=78915 RepID=A0A4P9XNC7_9FUNG|nr:hypothetical protein THASP1DRAFT_30720 [Thamnocephalis sphaerospora]|eukprot:RKP07467.1 hypothetical protein THASP1DRAFT_30720 [Thamnocephalis sphaerospora]
MQLLYLSVLLLLFSSIITLANAQSKTPASTAKNATANPSPGCAEALEGDTINNSCIIAPFMMATINPSGFCEAAASSGKKTGCSAEQVNSALDLFESQCKDDLAKNVTAVQKKYTSWYTYPLTTKSLCLKDGEKYCASQQKTSNSTDELKCDACDKKMLELDYFWKADREPIGDTMSQKMKEMKDNAGEMGKKCNFELSAVSSASAPYASILTAALLALTATAAYAC